MIEDRKQLIDYAIQLDKDIKEKTDSLNRIKAKLQSSGLLELENRNIKYLQLYGESGTCDMTYRQKCDIDNVNLLRKIFGSQIDDKIIREEKITYKIDSKLKNALIALYMKDYNPNDINSILSGLGLDDNQIKLAGKKLKGDYFKDKQLLSSLGVDTENIEEELDAIRESKNYDLIDKYIDITAFDNEKLEDLKRAISVDETLTIGLSYEQE